MHRRIVFLFASLLAGSALFSQQAGQLPAPKNVIVMIGDGMGFNHLKALNYYQGKKQQVFEQFPVRLALAHYPAKAGEYEEGNPESNFIATGYNPSLAWKDTAYLKRDFTESAASGTALATGMKTYNNSIGISVSGDTLENLTTLAKRTGRSAGVVTSVQFSHATPAAFVAHNITRKNYPQIASEMIFDSRCDVIMGCGDPGFDVDGRNLTNKWGSSGYVIDSASWSQLIQGSGKVTRLTVDGRILSTRDCDQDQLPDPWTIIRTRQQFTSLKRGDTPKRVLGCPMVYKTLQQGRSFSESESDSTGPWVTPLIETVPSLADMALGALNTLDQNQKGLFLMIEGGAIDWASHANQQGRLIEEMVAFSAAVDSVINWIEHHGGWENTLLIITADHETGLLWGKEPFAPIIDNGKGELPGMQFYSTDHTNSLVPFFARGAGSELYPWFADEYDSIRGQFLQNSELAPVIRLMWNDELKH